MTKVLYLCYQYYDANFTPNLPSSEYIIEQTIETFPIVVFSIDKPVRTCNETIFVNFLCIRMPLALFWPITDSWEARANFHDIYNENLYLIQWILFAMKYIVNFINT